MNVSIDGWGRYLSFGDVPCEETEMMNGRHAGMQHFENGQRVEWSEGNGRWEEATYIGLDWQGRDGEPYGMHVIVTATNAYEMVDDTNIRPLDDSGGATNHRLLAATNHRLLAATEVLVAMTVLSQTLERLVVALSKETD